MYARTAVARHCRMSTLLSPLDFSMLHHRFRIISEFNIMAVTPSRESDN